MSNIYIQEPPTSGKVLLKTTVGDIEIELWTREVPKACRNFIQLCLEGYYAGTIFHRIVKGFIIQGGDPNGDGTGGESIYGEPFKDEFHTRLRFVRRGLVAMANSGKDDNGSQFFFTLAATPELQNKHTIFGKVAGETIFNMLKLEDGLIGADEKPLYPNKILKTEVIINPYTDIIPRIVKAVADDESKAKSKKDRQAGVKNFKLLSFGEEAEEDEEMTNEANIKFSGKSKSTHDVLNDPKLSSIPAVGAVKEEKEDDEEDIEAEKERRKAELENIKKKLKTEPGKKTPSVKASSTKIEKPTDLTIDDDDVELDEYYLGKDREDAKKKKVVDLKKEFLELKKKMYEDKKAQNKAEEETQKETKQRSELMKEYEEQNEKYAQLKQQIPKKGKSREEFTLQLLEKFQKKLGAAKEKHNAESNEEENTGKRDMSDGEIDEDENDDSWLAHKLSFADNIPVLARDANTKDDHWYDINDPRHPLNRRRREEHSKKPVHKKAKHK